MYRRAVVERGASHQQMNTHQTENSNAEVLPTVSMNREIYVPSYQRLDVNGKIRLRNHN
jgi:hypothetical protein